MATHSSIRDWRIPWTEKPAGVGCYSPWGSKESDMTEVTEYNSQGISDKYICIFKPSANFFSCILLYRETQILFQQTISNNFHESLVLTKLKIYPAKYTFPQILNTRYFHRKSNPNVYDSFTLKSSKHYLTIPFGCLILCFPNCIIVCIFKKKLLSALNYLDNCVNHILCILHVDKS